jgi:hypothetical protein
MQKITFYLLLIILGLSGKAQAQISISENPGRQPHPSAILDITNDATNGNYRGVLLPLIPLRNSTDRTSIPSPDDYLLVFSPYAAASSYAGLNYWHNNRWHRFLNQSELYGKISDAHIAQIVLFSQRNIPEDSEHSTDPANSAPYKFSLDTIIFDSQSAFNKKEHLYVIPEDGLYEILCNATVAVSVTQVSVETFVMVDGKIRAKDLIANISVPTVAGSVIYVTKLKKGQRVNGALGVGVWNSTKFKVIKASLTIVKY